ncbi:hypothetical protein ACIPRL_36765 [Streptomyces sp. NPDC090085]
MLSSRRASQVATSDGLSTWTHPFTKKAEGMPTVAPAAQWSAGTV